jgi:serine/threonine-protein kinase RsbW
VPLSDQIQLRIPATIGHIGLARATATALAARLDFTYDRLMDLHIALDESSARVLAVSEPRPRFLNFSFGLAPDGLEITVVAETQLKPGAEFLNPWSKLILESVASDLDVRDDGEVVGMRFAVKRGALP